jgi:hypothetical protein
MNCPAGPRTDQAPKNSTTRRLTAYTPTTPPHTTTDSAHPTSGRAKRPRVPDRDPRPRAPPPTCPSAPSSFSAPLSCTVHSGSDPPSTRAPNPTHRRSPSGCQTRWPSAWCLGAREQEWEGRREACVGEGRLGTTRSHHCAPAPRETRTETRSRTQSSTHPLRNADHDAPRGRHTTHHYAAICPRKRSNPQPNHAPPADAGPAHHAPIGLAQSTIHHEALSRTRAHSSSARPSTDPTTPLTSLC